MNELEKIYDTMQKEHINFDNYHLTNKTACIIYYDDYYILLDKDKVNNSTEEKIALIEELGHYYTNSLYKVYNNPTWIKKCEYRAKKWQINKLIPLDKLKKYIDRTVIELADIFDVTIEFMYEAISFYKEMNLISNFKEEIS